MLLLQLPNIPVDSNAVRQAVAGTGGIHLFGIRLVGFNAHTGVKLLLTLGVVVAGVVLARLLHALFRWTLGWAGARVRFWFHQGARALVTVLAVLMLVSVWVDQPAKLATAIGLATAGLAFALQKVITSIAGYVVILRGKTFSVGDRIKMGGVRGDVVALDFIHTTIMEMGQPPDVKQSEPPGMWVEARQYTGRIVTVTNDKVFDEPVYNYTRDFPYIWEEMHIPVSYRDDRARAEQILLEAATRHTTRVDELGDDAVAALRRRYFVQHVSELEPRVFWRITDNWLELAVRFLVPEHGIRDIKDAMSRDILAAFDAAKIGIASGTYDIVGLPHIRVRLQDDRERPA